MNRPRAIPITQPMAGMASLAASPPPSAPQLLDVGSGASALSAEEFVPPKWLQWFEGLFEDGEHVVLFDGPADLRSKVLHYARDEAARQRIVMAAHALVQRLHTWDARARFVTRAVQVALARHGARAAAEAEALKSKIIADEKSREKAKAQREAAELKRRQEEARERKREEAEAHAKHEEDSRRAREEEEAKEQARIQAERDRQKAQAEDDAAYDRDEAKRVQEAEGIKVELEKAAAEDDMDRVAALQQKLKDQQVFLDQKDRQLKEVEKERDNLGL